MPFRHSIAFMAPSGFGATTASVKRMLTALIQKLNAES
jgi:hypothetical protein